MDRTRHSIVKMLFLLSIVSLISSCGGGGGGGGGTSPSATLVSISLTPSNPTIAKGAFRQFAATGTYSDSTTHDITSQSTWTSLNPGIATMSTTTAGRASSLNSGTATIKVSSGGISGTTTLTVVTPTLVNISVTPANITIGKNLTKQFTATGTYTPSLTLDITSQVTWTTSDPTVVSMSSSTLGLASALATGSATVTAIDAASSLTGSTTISVLPLLGGSVQKNPLSLSNVVSTFCGTASGDGHTDGIGQAARFYEPAGITTDGTNLYVTDKENYTIRKIVIATGDVSTVAGFAPFPGATDGTGTAARFNIFYGITTDGTNLYVADTYSHTIRKVVISTGEVTTLAGMKNSSGSADGIGTAASFFYPYGITTDGTNLYVADTYNHTIRQIVLATRTVTTLAGSAGYNNTLDGTGSAARFDEPAGITTDGVNLYVADSRNHAIRKVVLSSREVTTFAGAASPTTFGSTDGTGWAARFYYPFGITMDGTNLYVADTFNHTIRKIEISTAAVTTLAGQATVLGSTDGTGAAAKFSRPYGIVTDGTSLYVADTYDNTIRKVQ